MFEKAVLMKKLYKPLFTSLSFRAGVQTASIDGQVPSNLFLVQGVLRAQLKKQEGTEKCRKSGES